MDSCATDGAPRAPASRAASTAMASSGETDSSRTAAASRLFSTNVLYRAAVVASRDACGTPKTAAGSPTDRVSAAPTA